MSCPVTSKPESPARYPNPQSSSVNSATPNPFPSLFPERTLWNPCWSYRLGCPGGQRPRSCAGGLRCSWPVHRPFEAFPEIFCDLEYSIFGAGRTRVCCVCDLWLWAASRCEIIEAPVAFFGFVFTNKTSTKG